MKKKHYFFELRKFLSRLCYRLAWALSPYFDSEAEALQWAYEIGFQDMEEEAGLN